jgi:hypothetical protein
MDKFNKMAYFEEHMKPLVKQLWEMAREQKIPLIITACVAGDGMEFESITSLTLPSREVTPNVMVAAGLCLTSEHRGMLSEQVLGLHGIMEEVFCMDGIGETRQ